MTYITLNENGFADVNGWIKCYSVGPDGEYVGEVDEYISATAGLPAGAYIEEPPSSPDGKAVIRSGGKWQLVEDHRGEIVYSTKTGQSVQVSMLGPIQDGFTEIAPATPFDKWNGSEWVTDLHEENTAGIAQAEQQKYSLRLAADSEIAWRQDAVDAEIATDKETADLASWKKYRVSLMRVDTSKPAWPPAPE